MPLDRWIGIIMIILLNKFGVCFRNKNICIRYD